MRDYPTEANTRTALSVCRESPREAELGWKQIRHDGQRASKSHLQALHCPAFVVPGGHVSKKKGGGRVVHVSHREGNELVFI